jgi:hypothetical protein
MNSFGEKIGLNKKIDSIKLYFFLITKVFYCTFKWMDLDIWRNILYSNWRRNKLRIYPDIIEGEV